MEILENKDFGNASVGTGEIVVYQPDEITKLEVRVNDDTVWLTQTQMSDLFGRDRTVITKHIRNIFLEQELDEKSNVHFLHFANSDKPVKLFSLDVIISVGYRVKSTQGVFFDGQIYDAYAFVADLVRKAARRIVLIDNYIDDTVSDNRRRCLSRRGVHQRPRKEMVRGYADGEHGCGGTDGEDINNLQD